MLNMKLVDEAGFEMMDLIKILSINPRKLYNKSSKLEAGQRADLVLIDPDYEYCYSNSFSRSKNTPLLGRNLKGKVMMTIKDGSVKYIDFKVKKGD